MEPSAELVERARRGSRASLEALLEQHLPALRAYVRLRAGRLVRAREESGDLVQSVCREVLADLSGFEYRSEGAFRQWLFDSALRKILDRQRYWTAAKRDGAHASLDAGGGASDGELLRAYSALAAPSQQVQVREEIARLEQAFDRLPEHYREVVVQARILGLTQAEIARRTDRTEDAVRNLLARALARLSSLLAD